MAKSLVENLSAPVRARASTRTRYRAELHGADPSRRPKGVAAAGAARSTRREVVDLMAGATGLGRADAAQARRVHGGKPQRLREPRQARRVQPQARPEADARAVHVEGASARRQPIFVVQRHDARAPSLRPAARARRRAREAGPSRRASLSTWASAHSRCTSRTTRSSTRPSRARSRRGSTAQGRSRSGTRGTYEFLEEKRDGGLTVRLRRRTARRGLWTLVPAHLDGNEKNWLLLRKRDETRPPRRAAATTSRCSPRSPSDAARRRRTGSTR